MAQSKVPPPPERLPKHIVLIPDGNARWAASRGRSVIEGHKRGADAVQAFLRVCREWKIPVATIWGFSTENWARSKLEVDAIMHLMEAALRRNRPNFKREGIRFRHIGRRDRIASRYPRFGRLLADLEEETRWNEPFILNLALDYGGRDEVIRALQSLIESGLRAEELTWEHLAECLDTAGQPDPDLVIRSSGEHRLSGILPLQSAYAEIVFVSAFLPELREDNFREAIREYASRERRFGRRREEDRDGVDRVG